MTATLSRSFSKDFREFGITDVSDRAAIIEKLVNQEWEMKDLREQLHASESERAKLVSVNKILREHMSMHNHLQEQLRNALKTYDEISAKVTDHVKLAERLHGLVGEPVSRAKSFSVSGTGNQYSPFPEGSVSSPLPRGGPSGGGTSEKGFVAALKQEEASWFPTSPVVGKSRRGSGNNIAVARSPFAADDAIALLKMFSLFAEFPDEVLNRLAMISYEMFRTAGQQIITKGEMGAEIYFLAKGDVHVMAAVVEGEAEEPLATLSDRSFFGELGVLFDKPRTANVRASTDCHIVVVTKQKIHDTLQSYPDLKQRVEMFAHDREKWWSTREYKAAFGMEFIANIARQDITKLPIFAEAPDVFLEKLAQRCTSETFAPSSTIVQIGDDSDSIFFVIRGSALVISAEKVVHAELGPGAFFGELGIILNINRTASIVAKEECFALKLTKESLIEVQEAYPAIKAKIQDAVNERFALYQERCKQVDKAPEQFDVEVSKQQLKKLGIFRNVDDMIIGELAHLMKQQSWKKGDKIIECGQKADSMFFLTSGEIDVLSEFGEQIDRASGPDAWFGEVALLQDVPRTATIRARSECSTFMFRKDDFMALLKKNPVIAERIEETARDRLQAHLMRNILA
ncbi:cyclic nucleotide-binding-like protein [Fimicolochytrium jonesii]|uniref:cyclic nucleotide-binding-like protein n=1 Tax=Fimicolochytrium jonesii TaxID=1396493 RepID=UPI0022FEF802|nr:cyclic nucleotide-binding-like protein [Fimicolochytrium jonesii]KAI8824976.1 cyclic nucleotide-binding-like protein [Fimicolochytrium jonesii]